MQIDGRNFWQYVRKILNSVDVVDNVHICTASNAAKTLYIKLTHEGG